MAKPKEKFVNTNPDDATEGGFLDGVRCKITKAKYDIFTYPSGKKTTAAILTFKPKVKPEGAKKDAYEQAYSVGGGTERFLPAAGGARLKQAPGSLATTLNKKATWTKVLADLALAGVPKSVLGGSITALVGLDVTTASVEQTFEDDNGKKQTSSYVSISAIHNEPWSKDGDDGDDGDNDSDSDDDDEQDNDESDDESDSGDEEEEEEEEDENDSDSDSDESDSDSDEDETDAVIAKAAKYAKAALRKGPLSPEDLLRAVFKAAKADDYKRKIVAVIEDKSLLADLPGITYDKKKKLVSVG